jgi:hypothetical protein
MGLLLEYVEEDTAIATIDYAGKSSPPTNPIKQTSSSQRIRVNQGSRYSHSLQSPGTGFHCTKPSVAMSSQAVAMGLSWQKKDAVPLITRLKRAALVSRYE